MNTLELFDAVITAYEKKDRGSIDTFLKNGKISFANFNIIDRLHSLVLRGDKECAQWLIQNFAEVNAKDDKKTALHYAVSNGADLAVAELLIENGEDVHAEDCHQKTVLRTAVSLRRPKAVQLLIAKGANVHVRYDDQSTLLHWAAWHNDPTMADLLIEMGVDVNAKDDTQRTALDWTMLNQREKVAELLIEKGANLQVRNSDQKPLFHWAAENGYVQIVKLLLDKQEDVQARNNKQQTAFDRAIKYKQFAVLECLLPYQESEVITQAYETLVNDMQRFFPNTERISDKRLEGFQALMPYSMQCILYFLTNPEKKINALLIDQYLLQLRGFPQELVDQIIQYKYSIPDKLTACVECLRCCEPVIALPPPPNQVMEVIQQKMKAMKPKTSHALPIQTNNHSQEELSTPFQGLQMR